MKNNKGEKYTTSPYRLWALLSSVVVLVTPISFGYDLANGLEWQGALANRSFAAGTTMLVAFWISWAVSLFSPVWLCASGIRSYTLSGSYRLIAWEDMEMIDSVAIPGFHYARVIPKHGKAIWIPVWLVEKERFLTTAKKYGLVGVALERAFDGSVKHNHLSDASHNKRSMQEAVYHTAQ